MTKQQKTILAAIIGVVVIGIAVAAVIIGTGDNRTTETDIVVEDPRSDMQEPMIGTEGAGPEQAQPPPGPPPVRTGPAQPSAQRQPAMAQPKEDSTSSQPQTPVQMLERITSGKLGKPAMVELGADWCPPCRDMKPIIEALKKDYGKSAEFVFIDVDQHNDIAERFNVESIPVQLFFDSKGKQTERHVGFFARDEIVKQFSEMGVKKPG